MKVHHVLAWSSALLVGQFALAQIAQADEASPDPKVLGATEAILSFCAKVDPSGAANYLEQSRQMTHGASDEALAKARKSEEYRQARDSAEESLAKIDEQEAVKACARRQGQNG
jgi:hypothetical protein